MTVQGPTASLSPAFLRSQYAAGLDWKTYLATDPEKAANWRKIYDQVTLTDAQRSLVSGFTRHMKVLCVSGIWCGDCVQQGPLLERIAEASECVELRWVDRDEHRELAELFTINAGVRVPVVHFMAEDYEPVSIAGDRTLTRYRAMAAKQLAAACPLPGAPVPDEELAATLQDWLDEFERVQLLLRLSGRLRQKHGD
jgi:thiol-disulfide isomerase/thioredoxin